eukprot:3277436-Pleurochrysis_carterae.AAC.1
MTGRRLPLAPLMHPPSPPPHPSAPRPPSTPPSTPPPSAPSLPVRPPPCEGRTTRRPSRPRRRSWRRAS